MSITIAKLKTDYVEAKKLLRDMNFLYSENKQKSLNFSNENFSKEFKKASLKSDYSNCYKVARDNQDYNLLLEDNSFFQFGYTQNSDGKLIELRYSYYEAPAYVESYEDFLIKMEFDYKEIGDALYEEYQQYISETNLKNHVTSIRYDFNIDQRVEGIHPTSHLHIGQDNDIRLPMSFLMTPLTFVSFVIRHSYWKKWKIALNDSSNHELYLRTHSNNISLAEEYFSEIERSDPYLSI